jgi:hypothetical protein
LRERIAPLVHDALDHRRAILIDGQKRTWNDVLRRSIADNQT